MADEDVAGGVEWANQIAAGLGRTDAVVVLLTHNSLASPWVEREVAQSALAHIPMVPVSVDGVEPQGGLKLYLDTVQRISIADDDESDLWEIEQALLRRLSSGRTRSNATVQLRVGQFLQLIGGIGVIVAFGMFMFFAYQAISSEVPSVSGLGFDEAREQFEQNRRDSDQQFLRIASAFPVFFVSGIVAAIGTSMHRSALRKRM